MNRFVVHDEFGPIRAFPTRKEAEDYLDHLIDCSVDAFMVVKPKPPKPDKPNPFDLVGEAPF